MEKSLKLKLKLNALKFCLILDFKLVQIFFWLLIFFHCAQRKNQRIPSRSQKELSRRIFIVRCLFASPWGLFGILLSKFFSLTKIFFLLRNNFCTINSSILSKYGESLIQFNFTSFLLNVVLWSYWISTIKWQTIHQTPLIGGGNPQNLKKYS